MSKKNKKSPFVSKFEQEIFVTIENPGSEDEFQNVHPSAQGCASFKDGEKRVGRYVLKEVLKVQATASVTVE